MADSLLPDELRKWRGHRRQKEAASALGVSVRTYQNWENGVNAPAKVCGNCLRKKMKEQL